jgi:hypothetical protein
MSDTFDDESGNDVEFEVSTLGDASPGPTTRPHQEPPGLAPQPGDDPQHDAPSVSLESGSGSAPRGRLLKAGVASLVLALAVAIILAGFPEVREQLRTPLRFLAPSPTPTLAPGADIILLAHTVPWGTLRVNGQVDIATVVGNPLGYYQAYQLPRGLFTLEYVAAPFPPVHCTLSVPVRTSDTCKMLSNRELVSHPIRQGQRALDMGATMVTMESGERIKLQQVLENGVSYPPLTVEPGMHYLDQNANVMVARQRMTVTMAIGAVPPTKDVIMNDDGQPCGEFCAPNRQDDAFAWTLLITTGVRWMYAQDGAPSFTVPGGQNAGLTSVQVQWVNGQWTLDPESVFIGYPCFDTLGELPYLTGQASSRFQLDTFSKYDGVNPINGCLYVFSAQDNPGDHLHVELLLRLGVFLAANADAQRVFPELPVANAAERAIAQSIRAGAVQ